MSSQFTGTRKSRPFGLYRTHYLPIVHRVGGSYFRSRPKRKSHVGRRSTRTPLSTVKKEPKNVTWLPGDDYLLINSILLTCNLTEVYQTVRFSSHFTEKEVETRWRSLMFDPVISRTAIQAMARLPPLIKSKLNRLIPFSDREDALITKISILDVFPDGEIKPLSVSDLRHSVFEKLLTGYPTVFFSGRDELDLFRQWSRLQSCHVINEGTVPALSQTSSDPNTTLDTDLKDKPVNLNVSADQNGANLVMSGSSHDNNDVSLGGDPSSFSDTELLLEETTSSALSAGLEKLTEPSAAARRHRLLEQSTYHGFQSLVTEAVISALARQKQRHQEQQMLNESKREDALGSGKSCYPSYANRLGPVALSSCPERPGCDWSSRQSTTGVTSGLSPEFDFRRRLELYRYRKRLFARLRRTAEEAKRWTRLVEIRAASGLELTDPQPIYPALASLTGTRTRFLLKEKEVTFGRSSLVYQPHIDLSREGDSTRVSRCHGRIRLASNGTFWLANFSKHPVFVDGNPVLTDEEVELKDLATVLIAQLAFRFDVNHLYVNALCHGAESSVLSSFRAHDESDSGLISADNVSHHSHGYGSSGGGHFGHPDNSHHHGHADSTGSSHHMLHSPPSVAQSEPSSDVSTKN